MGRRLLTDDEARLALARGKEVQSLLGGCERFGKPGIRWISLHDHPEGVCVWIFDVQEPADGEQFVGVDHLLPLNPELDFGDPDVAWVALDFMTAAAEIRARYPAAVVRFVNEGMLDEEYADYVASGRR